MIIPFVLKPNNPHLSPIEIVQVTENKSREGL